MPAKTVAAKPAAKKPALKTAASKAGAKPAAKAAVKPAAKPRAAKPAAKKPEALVIETAAQEQLKQILAAFQVGGVTRSVNLGGKITKAQKEVLDKLAKQLGTTTGALQAAIIAAFLAGVK